jgi:hypothetical protein
MTLLLGGLFCMAWRAKGEDSMGYPCRALLAVVGIAACAAKKRPGRAVVVLAAGAGKGRHPAPLFQVRAGGQGIVLHPLLHHRAVGQALHVFPAELALAHCVIRQRQARSGLRGTTLAWQADAHQALDGGEDDMELHVARQE